MFSHTNTDIHLRHLPHDFQKPTMSLESYLKHLLKDLIFWDMLYIPCLSEAEVLLLNAIVFLYQKDSECHKKQCSEDPTKYFVMVGDTGKKKPCKA